VTTTDMVKIESVGSFWEFDTTLHRYRRWPKNEGPRERPEWSPPSGPLQDFVWHDMFPSEDDDGYYVAYGKLRIRVIVDPRPRYVSAPLPFDHVI
jgi:hypothetical protein